ncbi:DUF4132 domain-containing protein [Streptomyces sp. NPDC048404]|uniref:DUF4132 domain-containing protein n=1 Tax=unclassified Streptomyces TaxID=2593676 RepID=UPI003430A637
MTVNDIGTGARWIRERVAEGNMGELATELLRMAVDNRHGQWVGDRAEILDVLPTLPAEQRARLADALAERYHSVGDESLPRNNALILLGVVCRGLPGDRLAVERSKQLDEIGRRYTFWSWSMQGVLAETELATGRRLAPAVVAVFRRTAMDSYCSPAVRDLAKRLTEPVLDVGEEWAEQAMRDGSASDVRALLTHLVTATASKPSAKWDKRARDHIEALGADRVRVTALSWLALVGRPRTLPLERQEYESDINNAYDPYNANALRGLAWLVSLLPPHPDTARALGALVETSLKRVAGRGPRNPKVANAGVVALSRIDSESAFAELARLAARVTYKNTAKLLDGALEARATALGLTREEIEELAVPAYGLTEVGRARHTLGEITALLDIQGSRAVLGWRNASGKAVKSVPAAARRDHAEELKELKAAVKDIDRMLSAQTERLDRQFLGRRTWAYGTWRERCLDHPLVGTLARRLLWTVDGAPVGFANGELSTLTDDPVTSGQEVTLWHPVGREPAEVVAWRDWLERHEITQPFEQAHREVYLLTDAERATGTYSRRSTIPRS